VSNVSIKQITFNAAFSMICFRL